MKIQVAQSEVSRHSSQPWNNLTFRQRKWLVAKILRSRGDINGHHFARLVESGNPNFTTFIIIDDMPAGVGN